MTREEAQKKVGMELLENGPVQIKPMPIQTAFPGGQKQRAAIARGLAMNPDIMP